MNTKPPVFRYHPNAYEPETGVMAPIDIECECCEQARGWIYRGNVYAVDNVDNVCPWCIADGSVHRKWDASFSQDIEADSVTPEAVDEVMHRTPGYISWQGALWKTHCGDICEFHGDLPADELSTLSPAAESLFRDEQPWLFDSHTTLQSLAQNYTPKGDLSLYKFVCRHCHIVRLHADLS